MSQTEDERLIASDPSILMGKPRIAGTRITVEDILAALACGETVEQILAHHAELTEKGLRAALAFAAKALRRASDLLVDVVTLTYGPRIGPNRDVKPIRTRIFTEGYDPREADEANARRRRLPQPAA